MPDDLRPAAPTGAEWALAFDVLAGLVREEYPSRLSLSEIAETWGSPTAESLAALRRVEDATTPPLVEADPGLLDPVRLRGTFNTACPVPLDGGVVTIDAEDAVVMMRARGVHMGFSRGSEPPVCVTCDQPWPCPSAPKP